MKSVFRLVSPEEEEDIWFEQKAIDDDEQTPEGWTDNLDDLNIPEEEPTEMESIKQQIADLQEIVSDISGGGF